MRKNNKIFPTGKLKHEFLEKMLNDFVSDLDIQDQRVVIGSKIGEDAAVIDMGEKFLVAKTDPITFATDEIGYYVVNVNVNDVVCMGAKPKWFQSTILLPEKNTTEDLIKSIFQNIHDTCKSMDITVIGGHTEITPNLDRPIVIGSLLGEVEKEKLVNTSEIKAGDALILTKGIFIEGTSIIGREKELELKIKGLSKDFIMRCKNYLYNPGISVFKEALLANKNFKINGFHDVTEGGLACAVAEMAMASNNGILIEEEKIKILPEPLELSNLFNLNPFNTISSGSLLIAVDDQNDTSLKLIEILNKNDILAEKIGKFLTKKEGMVLKQKEGPVIPLKYSETDEITKIFR
ncbi:MAG: hydrogenase expression/formation protein [Promethearchaeota archaeon]|nr:MAG: hydrogenase expression/formation protein [Candidatus Lokiarchaeota archaeon]